MKNINILLVISVCLMSIWGCQKDDDVVNQTIDEQNTVNNIDSTETTNNSNVIYGPGYEAIYFNDSRIDSMISQIAGEGMNIFNVQTNIDTDKYPAFAYFYNQSTSGLGLDKGILLSTGNVNNIFQINDASDFSHQYNPKPIVKDDDLKLLENEFQVLDIYTSFYDVVVLEFDFTTTFSEIELRYIFGSEEYPEYVGHGFHDAIAIFLSDSTGLNKNLATINGDPVSIETINNEVNSEYYVDNDVNPPNHKIEYDGFTKVLTAKAINLEPNKTYHIKFIIADAGDDQLDSGVFIEFGGMTSK